MRPIDADKLIDQIDIIRLYSREADDSDQLSGAVVKKFIQSQPTIDPEDLIPHGKWLERVPGVTWECSRCSGVVKNITDYCPNCGAKMDKE